MGLVLCASWDLCACSFWRVWQLLGWVVIMSMHLWKDQHKTGDNQQCTHHYGITIVVLHLQKYPVSCSYTINMQRKSSASRRSPDFMGGGCLLPVRKTWSICTIMKALIRRVIPGLIKIDFEIGKKCQIGDNRVVMAISCLWEFCLYNFHINEIKTFE